MRGRERRRKSHTSSHRIKGIKALHLPARCTNFLFHIEGTHIFPAFCHPAYSQRPFFIFYLSMTPKSTFHVIPKTRNETTILQAVPSPSSPLPLAITASPNSTPVIYCLNCLQQCVTRVTLNQTTSVRTLEPWHSSESRLTPLSFSLSHLHSTRTLLKHHPLNLRNARVVELLRGRRGRTWLQSEGWPLFT